MPLPSGSPESSTCTENRLPVEMSATSQNGFWCTVIANALADAGITFAIISPGGRSAAMAMSLRQQKEIRCVNHIDERSGAFMALAATMTTGRPSVICTTSGSAVANVLPALTEAYARRLPLIVVSCDRPYTTRGKNAPQSTNQTGICAPITSAQLDLDDPSDEPTKLFELRRDILRLIDNSVKAATAGPIHINVPQPGRLCANEINDSWRPILSVAKVRQMIPASIIYGNDKKTIISSGSTLKNVRPGLRGLIFVGSDSPLTTEQVRRLAEGTRFPIIADIGSHLRGEEIEGLIYTADALCLLQSFSSNKIEFLIRVGAPPVSSTLQQFLAGANCEIISLTHFVSQGDYINNTLNCIAQPDDESVDRIINGLQYGNNHWQQSWISSDQSARKSTKGFVSLLPWCEIQAAYTVVNATSYEQFYIANSMSIRHANILMMEHGTGKRVLTQRGVNGIDGNIGAFIGALMNSNKPGLLLIGDEAMTHDIAALANPCCSELNGLICIMNNHGGGIFDFTQSSRLPDFTGAMRNPPSINFGYLAKSFGLYSMVCDDVISLKKGLVWGIEESGIRILDIQVPSTGTKEQVHALYQSILSSPQ